MEHPISIYNTLTRKKEQFIPLHEPHVGMYVCGPTVYGDAHLGHARPAITFDLLFRYLTHIGYKVRYVRNITDVGHLEHDADDGEDKIAKKARLEQLEPMEVVQYYLNRYHHAMEALNVLPPSIEPHASGHIIEQIELVKKILDNGYAYESEGSVYFDVAKYNKDYHYGKLSGRNLDDVLNPSRELDGQSEKQDIALGVDVRSGEELPYLEIIIRKWRENKYPFSILFLDSSDEVLIKRFKETRRSHPLSRNGRVEKGIELEREKLAFLKKEADQVIDTSRLLTKELRHELENLYSEADGCSSMFITVVSFGFKYGIPADADLVFDVRFLPNPYYVEELRFHTGTEQAVQDYVMQGGTGEEFLKKLNDLLEFVIPKYEQEGKTQLVIAIGCTGGRHRSVTIAGEVFKRLTESGRYEIRLEHRDAGKDGGK